MKPNVFLTLIATGLICVAFSTPLIMADLDAGGGPSSNGTYSNWGSIGGPIEASTTTSTQYTHNTGLIQILFAGVKPNFDSNGNGLPDTWENQYFPGQFVNPLADADGDGTNNLMEYLAGTHPTDKSSFFRPDGTIDKSSNYIMPIQTQIDRTYKIWSSTDLQEWKLQQTITGDGGLHVFSLDLTQVEAKQPLGQPAPRCFFRVEINAP